LPVGPVLQGRGFFPRSHSFTLGERIERRLHDPLEVLIQARYTRQRGELLHRANQPWPIPRERLQWRA
jgi:hypothetical protein